MSTKTITKAAIIAAVYAAVSLILTPISYGFVQCRLSEALTLLPLIMPEAVPGLFVGCIVANLVSGAVWYDVVFGSLATLIAALLTCKSPNMWIGAAYPVAVNALVVGTYLGILYHVPIIYSVLSVAAGQAVACYGVGIPMLMYMKRRTL